MTVALLMLVLVQRNIQLHEQSRRESIIGRAHDRSNPLVLLTRDFLCLHCAHATVIRFLFFGGASAVWPPDSSAESRLLELMLTLSCYRR